VDSFKSRIRATPSATHQRINRRRSSFLYKCKHVIPTLVSPLIILECSTLTMFTIAPLFPLTSSVRLSFYEQVIPHLLPMASYVPHNSELNCLLSDAIHTRATQAFFSRLGTGRYSPFFRFPPNLIELRTFLLLSVVTSPPSMPPPPPEFRGLGFTPL